MKGLCLEEALCHRAVSKGFMYGRKCMSVQPWEILMKGTRLGLLLSDRVLVQHTQGPGFNPPACLPINQTSAGKQVSLVVKQITRILKMGTFCEAVGEELASRLCFPLGTCSRGQKGPAPLVLM